MGLKSAVVKADRVFGSPAARDLGLLMVRVMIGVVFVFHGSQKLFGAFDGPGIEGFAGWLASIDVPMPKVSAYLAACSEFFGGCALIAGLFTRLAVLPMAFTMFVAISTAHAGKGFSGPEGCEYPLTLMVILLSLVLLGPGRIAIDQAIKAVVLRR